MEDVVSSMSSSNTVEIISTQILQSQSFSLISCGHSALNSFFADAASKFKVKLQEIVILREQVKVYVSFFGGFVENREISYENWREVEHILLLRTTSTWIDCNTDIDFCFYAFVGDLKTQIYSNLPQDTQLFLSSPAELTVFVSDLDDDLD